MADKPIGKVVHYYDKIGVAIIKLEGNLKAGNKLKFVRGDNEFEQVASSMQFDHKEIDEGKKGQEVGVKVDQKTPEGMLVYTA